MMNLHAEWRYMLGAQACTLADSHVVLHTGKVPQLEVPIRCSNIHVMVVNEH
jgi:hypothetical protein